MRDLRKAKGWTQEELAHRAAVSRTDIVNLEKGRNRASSHAKRRALARGFDLTIETIDALLDGSLSVATLVADTEAAATGTEG